MKKKPNKKRHRFSFRLPPESAAALEHLMKTTGKTKSQIIREAISELRKFPETELIELIRKEGERMRSPEYIRRRLSNPSISN